MSVVFLLKQMNPKASTICIRFTHDYLNEKESRIHSSSEVTHTDDLQGRWLVSICPRPAERFRRAEKWLACCGPGVFCQVSLCGQKLWEPPKRVESFSHPKCGQWLETSQRLPIRPCPTAGSGAESSAPDREIAVRNLSHEPRCQRRRAGCCPSTGPPLLVQVRKWRYRSCTYSAVSFTNFNVVKFLWRYLFGWRK